MTLTVRDGANTPRSITEIVVRDGTNTPRTVSEIWVRDTTNTPRLVYTAGGGGTLTAAAAPTDVFGTDFGIGSAETDQTTATPTGGVGPYTYVWTLIGYTGGVAPNIFAPTAATTSFIQTSMTSGDVFYASFKCTVTDSLSATAETNEVNATFYSP